LCICALWLSDSFRLSDNLHTECGRVVRFFPVIRQPLHRMRPGCPILSGYPTTSTPNAAGLSDSLRLSDNLHTECGRVVRFFPVIRQPAHRMRPGCPITASVIPTSHTQITPYPQKLYTCTHVPPLSSGSLFWGHIILIISEMNYPPAHIVMHMAG
jgi:hypothetical protein